MKNPSIWYIIGLCRSKFDPILQGLNEREVYDEFMKCSVTLLIGMTDIQIYSLADSLNKQMSLCILNSRNFVNKEI